MIYLCPLGQDIKMDVDIKKQDVPSVELGRNFSNKVWNAGRFLLMKYDMAFLQTACPSNENKELSYDELSFSDKWILSKYNSTIKKLNSALDNYKVNEYSKILYDFIWQDFCSWFVEILKVELDEDNGCGHKQALMRFAMGMFDGMLKLLHPVMPFITEEIWHLTDERSEDESISLQSVPDHDESKINSGIEQKFELSQMLVEEIRRLKAKLNVSPSVRLPLLISLKDTADLDFFRKQSNIIAALAKCSEVKVEIGAKKPESALASVVREIEIFLSLGDTIDIGKEKERLEKEIDRLRRNILGCEKKLSNEKFVSNAPESVVAREREKLESMKGSLEKVIKNLNDLD
jgi:valyl-tRNA synthetase